MNCTSDTNLIDKRIKLIIFYNGVKKCDYDIFVKVRKNSSLSRKDKNVVDLGGFADRLKNKMLLL